MRLWLLPLVAASSGCSLAPAPATTHEVSTFATAALGRGIESAAPLSGPIDIYDAVARAVAYSPSLRVEEFGLSATDAKLTSQNAGLLPGLVAETDYYRRNAPAYTRSNMSPYYSTSTDASDVARSLSFSWHMLDFGLSYVRAQQAGDKALYQAEERRKVLARVIEDVRTAYWRAVTLDRLTRRMDRLRPEIEVSVAAATAAVRDGSVEPLPVLNYQREILTLQREYDGLRNGLIGAKEQLAQLMGLPQGTRIVLKETREAIGGVPALMDVQSGIKSALEHRFEVRQLIYESRINEREMTATILQVLPGLDLSGGPSADSNSYLYRSNWVGWGAKASWNLMNVVRLPVDRLAIDAQTAAIRERATALATVVAMQVCVSHARASFQITAFKDAERYLKVQRQITRQTEAAAGLGKLAAQSVTKEVFSTVLAEAKLAIAYADLQSAQASYMTALGRDLVIVQSQGDVPVARLADELRRAAHSGKHPLGTWIADLRAAKGSVQQ